ncbi:MAG: hypothetical protein C0405_01600 [Desulfovibrio sp.]|nr:hypothetical protein [Desulfovibrio sp.]
MNRQNPIPPGEPAQAACRQRGSIVVYLAITLVVFGVLAMAGAGRFGSSILGVSAPNCATQARLMAESGVRYATARLRTATSQATLTAMIATLNGQTLTVDATRGLSFTLTVTASGTGNALVSSLGSACGGAIFLPTTTTQATASVNVPAAGGGGGGGTPGEGINFARDIASFATTPGFSGQAGITVNVAAGTISLGNALYANSASVWYTGNRDVCSAGNCTLGNGLCAYFEYEFTSGSTGDGFVWTLMSGDTNTNASNGGDTGRGELMGYGGLGSSGLGIQAPKFGVEFDIYNNGCAASACTVGSRCDSNVRDHVAQVFWGAQTVSGCNTTYDDNRHAAGADNASEPRNSSDIDSTTGYDGYYYRTTSNDWMKTGGKFLYRFELDRSTTVNAEGNYCYQVRSWVKKPTDTFPAGLSNCTIAYSGPPDLTSVENLTPAMHQKLNKVFFGWTEGTGGATQLATLSNFSLYYKAAPTVPIVPQDYVSGWSMYEATGATMHDMNATNHNDGTIAGTGQWVPGIGCPNCSALRFNANNGRVTVPDSASLDLSAAGSIACWINIQGNPSWAGLVHKGVQTSFADETYSFQFDGGRRITLYINGAATRQVTSAALPTDNQWYHVAATWDAASLKVYINGTLSNTAANTGAIAATVNASAVTIGSQLPVSPYYGFTGIIDEVFMYNRALTATEIANMALGHP